MRELTQGEVKQVSGGFVGTPIPFVNGFIPGPNWPGGFPVAIQMAALSFHAGFQLGSYAYQKISSQYGMSTGEAFYHAVN